MVINTVAVVPTELTNDLLGEIYLNLYDVNITYVEYPEYLFYRHDDEGNIVTYKDQTCFPVPRQNMETSFAPWKFSPQDRFNWAEKVKEEEMK